MVRLGEVSGACAILSHGVNVVEFARSPCAPALAMLQELWRIPLTLQSEDKMVGR